MDPGSRWYLYQIKWQRLKRVVYLLVLFLLLSLKLPWYYPDHVWYRPRLQDCSLDALVLSTRHVIKRIPGRFPTRSTVYKTVQCTDQQALMKFTMNASAEESNHFATHLWPTNTPLSRDDGRRDGATTSSCECLHWLDRYFCGRLLEPLAPLLCMSLEVVAMEARAMINGTLVDRRGFRHYEVGQRADSGAVHAHPDVNEHSGDLFGCRSIEIFCDSHSKQWAFRDGEKFDWKKERRNTAKQTVKCK